tara:strand:+ start:281 stop:487 length:207 start_codon:yes stop_codon:yes gene_type:complete
MGDRKVVVELALAFHFPRRLRGSLEKRLDKVMRDEVERSLRLKKGVSGNWRRQGSNLSLSLFCFFLTT